jgi:hypothetical protein
VIYFSKNIKIKIYKTVTLTVALYWCEMCSLTLKEEHTLRMCEKRVLRSIFGHKGDEVREEWRKLHNDKLNDLYPSPTVIQVIKSRRIRWVGHMARKGDRRGVYKVRVHKVLVEKPEGKRSLGNPRRRWDYNIKVELQEVVCGDMDSIDVARNRDRWRAPVNAVMNLRVP